MLSSNQFTRDNRAYRQARSLVALGHDVTVLCTLCNESLPEYEEKDGIKIKRVLKWWLPIFPLSRLELYEGRLFTRFAILEKADIYQANDVDTLGYALIAAFRNKAKVFYDSREYWQEIDWEWAPTKLKRVVFSFYTKHLERLFARRLGQIITVNDEIAQEMRRNLKLKTAPITVMNTPDRVISQKNTQLRTDVGARRGDVVILYSGNFGSDRSVENVILAMRQIDKKGIFAILGDGPRLNNYLELIKQNELEGRVKLLKTVEYKKLISYISSADIGIIPTLGNSVSTRLSLPNKFFEYPMAGLVIVSSDLPVLNRLINKYQVGTVFNVNNPKDIADNINGLIRDKAHFNGYKNNLGKIASELNWENEEKKFIHAYDILIKKLRGSGGKS